MLLNKIKSHALSVFILLLTACASSPPVPDTDKDYNWRLHQEKLVQLTNWGLAGRISVQLEQEGWSASLYWTQVRDKYQLRIVAPLGRGTVEISGNEDSVSLHTADNRILEDRDVELLMQQNLGWQVPIDALVYWIKGLPEPGAATSSLEIDSMGRLAALNQSGWNISYEKYINIDGYDLPARMTVQREQLKLRLSINQWTLSDDP